MITEFCCGAEAPKEVEEEKPHDFEEHTYKIITKCDFCRKVLKGMRKQVGLSMLIRVSKFFFLNFAILFGPELLNGV